MSCESEFREMRKQAAASKDCGCPEQPSAAAGVEFESINAEWFKNNAWWIVLVVTVLTLIRS